MADNAPSKTKVSAPMIYALLIVIGTAIYLNLPNPNQGSTTAAKKRTTSTSSSTADANGITDADYKAHFPRYVGTERNPYIPAVFSASQENASGSGLFGKNNIAGGSWSLTGINIVNGAPSAVIESSNGDSVDLSVGDHWHGLRVVSVSSDTVTFQNALGQSTQLTFGMNDSSGANSTARSGMPSFSQVLPLPAISTAIQATPSANTSSGSSAFPTFNAVAGSRVRVNTNSSNANQNSDQGSVQGGQPNDFGGAVGPDGPPPPDGGNGGPPQ